MIQQLSSQLILEGLQNGQEATLHNINISYFLIFKYDINVNY